MRAVIDTNIFLAAALTIAAGKHTGSRDVFEELLPSGLFEHITSAPILYEIGDVLSRSELGVPIAMVEPFIAQIETLSIVVPIRNLSMGIADRKDDKFLETAVQGRADAIVTRDADFHHPGAQRTLSTYNCRVMSLGAFLRALNRQS